jgi:hypothetical protein
MQHSSWWCRLHRALRRSKQLGLASQQAGAQQSEAQPQSGAAQPSQQQPVLIGAGV